MKVTLRATGRLLPGPLQRAVLDLPRTTKPCAYEECDAYLLARMTMRRTRGAGAAEERWQRRGVSRFDDLAFDWESSRRCVDAAVELLRPNLNLRGSPT